MDPSDSAASTEQTSSLAVTESGRSQLAYCAFARTLTIVRAVLGAVLRPLIAYGTSGLEAAWTTAAKQWGTCGALMLLLTGRTTNLRLGFSMWHFAGLTLGEYAFTWYLKLEAS